MKFSFALTGIAIAGLALGPALINGQEAPPPQAKSMMKGKGMMNGQMMGQSMMSHHQEMSKLIDEVTAELSALQNEKDMAVIKKKLEAAHSKLGQVRTHMREQDGMMGPMMERMRMMDQMGKQTPAN